MITAYLDESQQSNPDLHVVVAGFCGTEAQWKAFIPAWQAGLGKRPHLHMKRIRWNRRGADSRIREQLSQLATIPYECGLVPVYGSARVRDYYDLIQTETKFEQKVKGYILCLGSILAFFMRYYPAHEKINVVCESQERYQPLAEGLFKTFQHIGGPQHPYFSTISHLPKSPMTEPADFLAFALGKHYDEPGTRKDLLCRPIHKNQYTKGINFGVHLNRDGARQIISEARENLRGGNRKVWKEIMDERRSFAR